MLRPQRNTPLYTGRRSGPGPFRTTPLVDFLQEWAQEMGAEVGRESLPVVLSRRQVEAATAADDLIGLALRTLYASAMRPAELLDLRPHQLSERGILHLPDRSLPVDPTTARALKALAGLKPPDARLFEVSPQQLTDGLTKALGPKGLTAEALRHACATHLLENGMDLFVLHRLLGHRNLGVTQQYLRTAVALRGAAYARAHPLMQQQRSAPGWNRADLDLEEELGQDPTEDRVATPTVAEVTEILAAANTPRDRCLLRLYYATGMRRNELIQACWDDVVEEEFRIFVRSGKNDLDRYVLLDPGSLQQLLQLRPGANQASPGQPLFALKESRVGEIFRSCADRCGLRARYAAQGQKLTLHSLRHAFATHCYANGMELHSLKRLLGHARISTTAIYVECGWDHCQACYDRLLG